MNSPARNEGTDWDYCHIEIRLRNDLGTAGEIGTPALAWTYFLALGDGPTGGFIAGRSKEIPMPSTVLGVDIFSTKRSSALDGLLQDLLSDLRHDGWEELAFRGGSWWEKRLRRPHRPRKTRLNNILNRLRFWEK